MSLLGIAVAAYGMYTTSVISKMDKPEAQAIVMVQYKPVPVRYAEVKPPTTPIPKGYFRRWTPDKGFQLIKLPAGANWSGN